MFSAGASISELDPSIDKGSNLPVTATPILIDDGEGPVTNQSPTPGHVASQSPTPRRKSKRAKVSFQNYVNKDSLWMSSKLGEAVSTSQGVLTAKRLIARLTGQGHCQRYLTSIPLEIMRWCLDFSLIIQVTDPAF